MSARSAVSTLDDRQSDVLQVGLHFSNQADESRLLFLTYTLRKH